MKKFIYSLIVCSVVFVGCVNNEDANEIDPNSADAYFERGKEKQKLKDYNDDDFILAMGDPVAIGISCIIASEVNNGKVNILKWDRENSCYYNVKINMYQKGESDV